MQLRWVVLRVVHKPTNAFGRLRSGAPKPPSLNLVGRLTAEDRSSAAVAAQQRWGRGVEVISQLSYDRMIAEETALPARCRTRVEGLAL